MYSNPYMSNIYNQQSSLDRINEQINQLENLKKQMQQPIQPTNLTQNFQLAPTTKEVIRYANSMEEVGRDIVIGDTPYFSKDMSVVWIKNTKGEIKTYELNEILPKDDKDIKIEYLQAQIEELKKGIKHESNADVNESIDESIKSKKSSSISNVSKYAKESK